MDEKRCGQINIYQFYLELLRKEFVMQVKYFTDITQQISTPSLSQEVAALSFR